jgi:hypothetical protein
MKRTKLMDLKYEFINLSIKEEESIENIYTRLIDIQNEFDKLGKFLSNSKIIDKNFRIMMRRSR